MNKFFRLACSAFFAILTVSCQQTGKYAYETVEGDPLQTRIYTLENGLKVYLSVNKETPRIQTYIAVRVGGKNDPAETTGLAHYFEHLMFKGSKQFGTQNYELEKPLLDEIERQFEIYRNTTDEAQRAAIYHIIDSLSYEASKYAIPNEYDKLMTAIGATGTNAYTAYDETVYIEDIPANQVENWARIQADRFENNVIRGFHTELETVYEEKNMSLTNDRRKSSEALLAALMPHHPYGTQTVLGTQEHLKNPSITNIKNYHKTWYVPNNMAICMSGDFNPDEVIQTLDKHFGKMKPNPNLPKLQFAAEQPIDTPIVREVMGPDAEYIVMGWRLPGASDRSYELLQVASGLLYNGTAGLIDLGVNQQQRLLQSYAYVWGMSDYSVFQMGGVPKQGQSLEQVRDILLEQVEKLRTGNFDEQMLQANINNMKLGILQTLETNEGRAELFVNSFINNIPWAEEVKSIDRMSKITKEEVVAFANEYLKANNYAIVYKRQGKDANEKKIAKPQITPIVANRDTSSAFLREIQSSTVKPIEPRFLDFKTDMSQFKTQAGIPILYTPNLSNDLFQLTYLFDMGNNHDRTLGQAFRYLRYLGTSQLSPEQVKSEFYRLACEFDVKVSPERTYVTLSGLNENLPAALNLLEKLMADAQVNPEAYKNLVDDELKARADAKANQQRNFIMLMNYGLYGPKSPATNLLSEQELRALNPQTLVDRIHEQLTYPHRILYYGPYKQEQLLSTLEQYHKTPAELRQLPQEQNFAYLTTDKPRVILAPYVANQIQMAQVSNLNATFDPTIEPMRQLYNEYFGGGMNSIVFQEMRETRALAYSSWAGMVGPSYKKYPYLLRTHIATQNDKMMDAITAFGEIMNNMPQSEAAFRLAQEGIVSRLRTERIIKGNILWSYIDAQDLGVDTDQRKELYQQVQKLTLQDVKAFQEQWVKGRTYTYCILGDKKSLDLESLKKIAPIEEVTTEQIFGY